MGVVQLAGPAGTSRIPLKAAEIPPAEADLSRVCGRKSSSTLQSPLFFF